MPLHALQGNKAGKRGGGGVDVIHYQVQDNKAGKGGGGIDVEPA